MDGNKKILIQKKTKVYVLAPANAFTGGPELLHQIAFNIRKIFKVKTTMMYLPTLSDHPVHKNFKKYNLEYTNYVEDNEKNILIIPEHFMFLKYALRYKKVTKILWWLSIDNYFGYKFHYSYNKFVRSLFKIPYNITNTFNKLTSYYFGMLTYHDYIKYIYKFFNIKNFDELKQIDLHLAQSKYAFDYLKKNFNNLKFLSDYQRQDILSNFRKNKILKKNIICYSNKSNDFINKIQKKINFKMIKLSGFNNKQLINVYKKTKIYLDFGYHPGKDRMPREAALFNNCIITNKRGSARNKIDIPISNKFKFEEKNSNLNFIIDTILNILKNYRNELKKFKSYKKIILNEEDKFFKDLRKIFIKK